MQPGRSHLGEILTRSNDMVGRERQDRSTHVSEHGTKMGGAEGFEGDTLARPRDLAGLGRHQQDRALARRVVSGQRVSQGLAGCLPTIRGSDGLNAVKRRDFDLPGTEPQNGHELAQSR